MDELEIMRQQLLVMKQRLDTQQIINSELMRRVMRSKASWLNKFVITEIILLPFLFLFILGFCDGAEISTWYAYAYLVLAGIDVVLDYKTVRIAPKKFGESSILELKKYLLKQKHQRFVQTLVATPLAIAWMVLFILDLYGSPLFGSTNGGDEKSMLFPALITGFIGITLGVIIIIVLYKKIQSTNDELLRDIQNLETD